MTDDEIVDAVKDKHGISIATGVYRQAHLDLVSMARADERDRIVAWLHEQWVSDATDNIDVFDMIDGIKAGDHLK